LIHGDLHLDNLIFDGDADRPVVVLDWQTAAVGPPAWDLALFVFGSLGVDDRRAAEAELFERYVTLLARHGVRDYSVEELQLDCRQALLIWLAGAVTWLGTTDASALTERERALQDASFADGRLVTALLDHNVDTVLSGSIPAP
jgi:aminoglycoside phosphotransferase (APT) family kinase protein